MWHTYVRCVRVETDGSEKVIGESCLIGESCHGSQYGTYDYTGEMVRMFNRLVVPEGYAPLTRSDVGDDLSEFSTMDGKYRMEAEVNPYI